MKLLVFILITFIFLGAHSEEISNSVELTDEKGSSVIATNLRTRDSILEYLNSLSTKELKELHGLRKKIYEEALHKVIVANVVSIGSVFMAGVVATIEYNFPCCRKKSFKYVRNAFLGLAIVTFLASSYRRAELSRSGDLDLDDSESIRKSLKDYINFLTLEEAKELLSDLKEINEELRSSE